MDKVMLYSASLVNSKTGRIKKEHIYIGVTNNLKRRQIEHNATSLDSHAPAPGIRKLHKSLGTNKFHVELKPLLSKEVSRELALDAEAYLIDRYEPICNRQCSDKRVAKFREVTFDKMYNNFLAASPKLTKDITE